MSSLDEWESIVSRKGKSGKDILLDGAGINLFVSR